MRAWRLPPNARAFRASKGRPQGGRWPTHVGRRNPTYEERSHASGSGDVYTYDRSNRLTKVLEWVADPSNEIANPGTETYADKVEYTMDEVHNLSSLAVTPFGGSPAYTSFTANSMNEYTAVGGTTHVYDSNGNLTDDGTNLYSYDFHNHLVKVVDKGTTTTIAEYEYDAVGRGRRTAKVLGSNTTRFIYHGQHVLEELDGSDTLLRLFAYADGWDNVVMMEAEDVADVDNDANTTELKRFYYHTQLIGSITHITDDDEVVVESYEYDAYGNTTIYDINSSSVSVSQIENPYMYTARRMDEESGLYHYRARAYSPTLRRFIQRDPLEYVDGPNALAYVRGRVTRSVDPRGLFMPEGEPGYGLGRSHDGEWPSSDDDDDEWADPELEEPEPADPDVVADWAEAVTALTIAANKLKLWEENYLYWYKQRQEAAAEQAELGTRAARWHDANEQLGHHLLVLEKIRPLRPIIDSLRGSIGDEPRTKEESDSRGETLSSQKDGAVDLKKEVEKEEGKEYSSEEKQDAGNRDRGPITPFGGRR